MTVATDMTAPNSGTLVLDGLDGANPLAFLGALGTVRVLDAYATGLTMPPEIRWVEAGPAWRPELRLAYEDGTVSRERFVDSLARALESGADDHPFAWARDTTVSPEEFRAFADEALKEAERGRTRSVEFAAALGTDAFVTRQGRIEDTALRTMSGAGHQHFLEFMQKLVHLTEPRDLDHALFEPWEYLDDKPAMRWDPADDRRYALRWTDPSKDDIRTVRGANRLAVEALPFMATFPTRRGLATVGFSERVWTWPIWTVFIPCSVVASVLTLPEVHSDPPDAEALRERGVATLFRSERKTVGKFRAFTPAVAVV